VLLETGGQYCRRLSFNQAKKRIFPLWRDKPIHCRAATAFSSPAQCLFRITALLISFQRGSGADPAAVPAPPDDENVILDSPGFHRSGPNLVGFTP
jgi:hypothetical protein